MSRVTVFVRAHLMLVLLVPGAALVVALVACGEPARAATAAVPAVQATPPPALPAKAAKPYGLANRPEVESYLRLAEQTNGAMPNLLSQTGAFSNLATLEPTAALIPYEVNTPLWSDGALKQRWIALPHEGNEKPGDEPRISFSSVGEWYFPSGTVLVKHFSLALDERDPTRQRRLETRFLVRGNDGRFYGITYRWRADGSDADLLADGKDEDFSVTTHDGGIRTEHWHYPSPTECMVCHNQTAGGVLGVSTRQLNRDFAYPGGHTDNQLRTWNHLGLFRPELDEAEIAKYPRTVSLSDESISVETRVRSYLDTNCSHCHRPGAMGFSNYDARFETPLERQNIIHGRVITDYGIDRPRYIKPRDPWRSMILVRQERNDQLRMPPLGRSVVDPQATALIRRWIDSLPGDPALPPPTMAPAGGTFAAPVKVHLAHVDPSVALYYTLDGSKPDQDSLRYNGDLSVERSATLLVKAYQADHAPSLIVSGAFIVAPR